MPVLCVCQNSQCGKSFTVFPYVVAAGRGQYCSNSCRAMAHAVHTGHRIEVTCENPRCGKTFSLTKHNKMRGRGKFCSHRCARIVTVEKAYPPLLVTCENSLCKKVFRVHPSERKVGKGKFCSRSCARSTPKARKVRVLREVTCQNSLCGKVFVVSTSADAVRRQFCSRACVHAQRSTSPEEERFWQKVRMCIHGPYCPFCCWPWSDGTNKAGYGIFARHEGDTWHARLANRLAWEFVNKRPLPKALKALHHCDEPGCCSIWHIYPGTQRQNIQDMHERGRGAKGSQLPQTKLSQEDIPLIFQRQAEGWSPSRIAEAFGVSPGSIRQVLTYKSWTHISLS